MPAREIWDTSVELSELIGPKGDGLWERVQAATTWESRVHAVNSTLDPGTEDRVAPELERAWNLLVASAGRMSVSSVAREVGWTRQHLTRCFTNEFGMAPKLAARVFRFNKAFKLFERRPPTMQPADIALACGYYDQSHMINDFVEFGGAPPGRIRDGEVTNLQDSHTPVDAD